MENVVRRRTKSAEIRTEEKDQRRIIWSLGVMYLATVMMGQKKKWEISSQCWANAGEDLGGMGLSTDTGDYGQSGKELKLATCRLFFS